ncbi:hypothetical protein NKH77_52030 [Streptomyces sp. M19]
MPAWEYPKQYGPRSPRFARATHLPSKAGDGSGGQIFVSGTASVLGHETVHNGDLSKQCQLALENIEVVVSPENLSAHGIPASDGLTALRNIKVYVRRPEDIPTVRAMYQQVFSPAADVAYLNVDVCRADLLVEIEGVVIL